MNMFTILCVIFLWWREKDILYRDLKRDSKKEVKGDQNILNKEECVRQRGEEAENVKRIMNTLTYMDFISPLKVQGKYSYQCGLQITHHISPTHLTPPTPASSPAQPTSCCHGGWDSYLILE